jgi:hypothetical protein
MPADVVFRVGRAYGMTADRGVYQAVAVSGGRIAAAERSRDDLDSLIGPGTAVIDDPELVLYPAFADTHNHQLLAARDLDYVALDQAHSIDELVQALRDAATRTPAGEWIISSRCWHETHLPSGTVVRLADGTPAGVLIEAGALDPVRRLLPPVTQAQQAGLLARQCQLCNRSGIGVVRDPGLLPDEVTVYQAVADRGELTTRTRLMFWVLPQATVADTLAYVDSLPPPGSVPGHGGGLGIWGLKMGMDGGSKAGSCASRMPATRRSAGTRSGSRTTLSRWWSTPSAAAGGSAAMPSATARSAGFWTLTSGWRRGTRAWRRGPWSSSMPSWPTRRPAPAPCGWAWDHRSASAAVLAGRQPGAVLGRGPHQPGDAGPGLGGRGGADRRGQRLQRQFLRPAAVHLGPGDSRHPHGGSPGA